MKRIAVSLGSLSLVLMQNGHCEPADPVEAFPSAITDVVSDQQSQESTQEDSDEFAFLETDPQELEEELLSLEQELETEQTPVVETEKSFAVAENTMTESPISANPEVSEPTLTETAIEEQKLAALEKTNETAAEEEEASLASKEIFSEASEIAVETVQTPQAETNSLIAQNEPSDELVSEIKEEMEHDISANTVVDATETAAASIPSASLSIKSPSKSIEISLSQVFSGSPMIYLMLLFLSIVSVALWLFNLMSLQKYAATSRVLMKNVRNKLMSNHYDEVLTLCKEDKNFFSQMISTGISSRKYGLQFMLESMKSEGKRASVSFWQRLNLLHDIAIIAPMLGLLGTVLGMFYAFYDLNRSFESISALFDGLGISVGTTVAGIFVAILAMVLHSLSKYRLVKSLSFVENEAITLAHLIDSNKHSH